MSSHPVTALASFMRGDLSPAEQADVAAHLQACAGCRQTLDETRRLLDALAATAPAVPEPDWRRYRSELHARLQGGRRAWWTRPLPVTLAVGAAAAALVVTLQLWPSPSATVDLVTSEEAAVSTHLGLLQNYEVVERLDLLEDLEVIRQLDRLPRRDG